MVHPAASELDDTVMSHSGELLLSHAPAVGGYGVTPEIDRQVTFKASLAGEWMGQADHGATRNQL